MIPKAVYPCDLHTHTNRSDGNDTCRELIDAAAESGLKVVVISDHDIIAPEYINTDGKAIPLIEYGLSKGVSVIPGIEFSCDTMVDDVHIVALGCDWHHPFFEQAYNECVESKIDGYRRLCALLTEDGLMLDWKLDILQGGIRAETAVQRKHIFEAMALKGYAPSWSDAKLLVKNSARYNVRREKPNPLQVIRYVAEAGGISIMAHPYLVCETAQWDGVEVTRDEYIEKLLDAGMTGIEACYPYNKTSYDGEKTHLEIEQEVRAKYSKAVKIISGGSDYHGEARKGAKNPRYLGEAGVTMEYFMDNALLRRLI